MCSNYRGDVLRLLAVASCDWPPLGAAPSIDDNPCIASQIQRAAELRI